MHFTGIKTDNTEAEERLFAGNQVIFAEHILRTNLGNALRFCGDKKIPVDVLLQQEWGSRSLWPFPHWVWCQSLYPVTPQQPTCKSGYEVVMNKAHDLSLRCQNPFRPCVSGV